MRFSEYCHEHKNSTRWSTRLKGGSCNAVVADRGVRASHFNCHFCTAKSYPRWCNVSSLKLEGSLALVLISTFALGVLVSLLISIPAIVKRRSAIANQSKRIAELENRSRNGSHRLDESCATGIVFWSVHLMRQLPADPTRTTVDSP